MLSGIAFNFVFFSFLWLERLDDDPKEPLHLRVYGVDKIPPESNFLLNTSSFVTEKIDSRDGITSATQLTTSSLFDPAA